jgi:hypothetical protein
VCDLSAFVAAAAPQSWFGAKKLSAINNSKQHHLFFGMVVNFVLKLAAFS